MTLKYWLRVLVKGYRYFLGKVIQLVNDFCIRQKKIHWFDGPISNMYSTYFYVYWFLCLLVLYSVQYCLFFCFCFLCLLVGVFNLYNTGYFFSFYITVVVHLYGTTHRKNNQLYNLFCFWFCVYSIYQYCFYY